MSEPVRPRLQRTALCDVWEVRDDPRLTVRLDRTGPAWYVFATIASSAAGGYGYERTKPWVVSSTIDAAWSDGFNDNTNLRASRPQRRARGRYSNRAQSELAALSSIRDRSIARAYDGQELLAWDSVYDIKLPVRRPSRAAYTL
jgi:hypothetical protein